MAYKIQKQELKMRYGSRCMLCERKLKKEECTYHHQIPISISKEISENCILCSNCQSIIHLFEYGSEAYKKLDIRIEKNKKKYKKY